MTEQKSLLPTWKGKYVICLNGAPYSGKDTLGKFLLDEINRQAETPGQVGIVKLAQPIRDALEATFFGGSESRRGTLSSGFWETNKDEPELGWFGKSKREVMIGFGELFLKKMFGNSVFAKLLALRNQHMQIIIVTDLGFPYEADTLRREFPNHQLVLINTLRSGCDFTKDSRQLVTHRDLAEPFEDDDFYWTFHNEGTLDQVRQFARNIVKFYVGYEEIR